MRLPVAVLGSDPASRIVSVVDHVAKARRNLARERVAKDSAIDPLTVNDLRERTSD